ncbi:UNVERIFIED_CONTAM: hypothetical protein GTU68_060349 [Idotea baltica]|nr:hypothetical protein [Idotea baltica]
MANHKSAIKSHRKSEQKKHRNTSILTRMKTFIKKVEELVGLGKNAEAEKALHKAESEIMKGVSKGTLKKNTASRKVSNLTKKVKAAGCRKVATMKLK